LPGNGSPRPGSRLLLPGLPFSRNELRAMELDGLLVNVFAAGFVGATETITPAHRALAAAALLPRGISRKVVLGRLTAAWVYGCAEPAPKVTVLMDHRYRATSQGRNRSVNIHEVSLGTSDTVSMAGVQVTSPLRTALDIAVHAADDEAVPALLALSAVPALKCPLGYVRQTLQLRQRMPGKAKALDRVSAALEQRGGKAPA
jgi:AbiEi antitoxin C-terminal domain